MPKVSLFGKYIIFFWSDDGTEPIHVHACEGKPHKDATKIWLLPFPHLAHNKSKIPDTDLNRIMQWLAANQDLVKKKWEAHFA